MSGTRSVPRIRCSGTTYSHEPAFLTIATSDPLVMRCVICGRVERVEDDDDA